MCHATRLSVVSYLDSTSNHNSGSCCISGVTLFHILILHQTTTCRRIFRQMHGCFISWFYIKPQLHDTSIQKFQVVSYLDSTSNHNRELLYLFVVFVVSYLDSTSNHNEESLRCRLHRLFHILILHQTTTKLYPQMNPFQLFHILILHQTTTTSYCSW